MAIGHARTMEAQWSAIAEIAAISAGPEGSAT
jgi:hypothetical protein